MWGVALYARSDDGRQRMADSSAPACGNGDVADERTGGEMIQAKEIYAGILETAVACETIDGANRCEDCPLFAEGSIFQDY